MPVYRVEEYIERCVISILKQSIGNIDLILVDDGSPDNCGAICDRYAEIDNRVKVIHQKNKGLSAARNAGIKWAIANSNSKWLAFVDSDDWVHPNYLEYLLKAVKKDNTQISVCNFIRESKFKDDFAEYSFQSEIMSGMELFESKLNIEATVAWNKLYAKELFMETRYPDGRLHEDEFVTYKLLYQAGDISWIDCPLYFYYQNPKGIIQSNWTEKRLDVYDAYEERIDFFRAEMQEKYYRHEFRRLFLTYYGFFVESMKFKKSESAFSRKCTKSRLNKSIIKYRRQMKMILSKYDRFSIYCLAYGNYSIQKWIVRSDFEPIQNILRRIKRVR